MENKYSNKKLRERVAQKDAAMIVNSIIAEIKAGTSVIDMAKGSGLSDAKIYDIKNYPTKPMTVKTYNKMFSYFANKGSSQAAIPAAEEEPAAVEPVEQLTLQAVVVNEKAEIAKKALKRLAQIYGREAVDLAYIDLYVLGVE